MWQYIIKIALSSIILVAASELAKRHTVIAAILASIPLISVLAITWLYIDTQNAIKVAEFSKTIFWLVIPSLAFFVSLPWLLQKHISFYVSLILSIGVTILFYFIMLYILRRFGIII